MVSPLGALGRLVGAALASVFFAVAVGFSTAVLTPLWFVALLLGNEFLGLTYPVVEVGLVAAVDAAVAVERVPLVVGDVPLLYPVALAFLTAVYVANPFTVSVGESSASASGPSVSVGPLTLEQADGDADGAGGDAGGDLDGGGGGGGDFGGGGDGGGE